jgi:hypothetical protein
MLISLLASLSSTSGFLIVTAEDHAVGVEREGEVAGVSWERRRGKSWGREAGMVVRVTRRCHRRV